MNLTLLHQAANNLRTCATQIDELSRLREHPDIQGAVIVKVCQKLRSVRGILADEGERMLGADIRRQLEAQ